MRKIIFVCMLLITLSCDKKLPSFYHGIVIDEYNKPIDSVIIKEFPPIIHQQSTITYKNGIFKLYGSENSDFITHLIFFKKKYKIDTISTISFHYDGTEESLFLNKIPDTIVLKKVK